MRNLLLTVAFGFCTSLQAELPISQVVLWGHKLHSHTHSYIHSAFVRAFESLGYKTLWLDNSDDISGIDFANTLFITEGQVEQKIPVRNDAWYILHNCDVAKYKDAFDANRAIQLQVYTHDVLTRNLEKAAPFIYQDFTGKTLYMPWATDLLPHEIDDLKKTLPVKRENVSYWTGTIGDGVFGNIHQIEGFKRAAIEKGIAFEHRSNLSVKENIELTKKSYIAPAIQGRWQLEKGYIPCRIFKAISYGQMGVTNSKAVSDLFEGKIVYNPDTYQLFHDADAKISSMQQSELLELMDLVRDNHTYLNRIEVLLNFLERVGQQINKEEL